MLGGEAGAGARAAAPTNYLGIRDSDDSDDDVENRAGLGGHTFTEQVRWVTACKKSCMPALE